MKKTLILTILFAFAIACDSPTTPESKPIPTNPIILQGLITAEGDPFPNGCLILLYHGADGDRRDLVGNAWAQEDGADVGRYKLRTENPDAYVGQPMWAVAIFDQLPSLFRSWDSFPTPPVTANFDVPPP